MAITAAFVVTASFVTERSGPVIGALVATLPISAGPSYVFLSLDQDAVRRRGRAGEPADQRRDDLSWSHLLAAGAAPRSRSSAVVPRSRFGSARRDRRLGAMVAGGWAYRQRGRVCDLRSAAGPLSPRQNAAGHAPLVRIHSAPRWSPRWLAPSSRCRAASAPTSAALSRCSRQCSTAMMLILHPASAARRPPPCSPTAPGA